MTRFATLPFRLRRSDEVAGEEEYTSTTETVHGLLRLEGDRLVIQWRLARETERMGSEYRTDKEVEPVREVVVPLQGVAGAVVRRRWWEALTGPRIVLTAADLRAFEAVTGEAGLRLDHPAELTLRLRRRDRLAGEEFCAELALTVAEQAVARLEERLLSGTRPALPERGDSPAEAGALDVSDAGRLRPPVDPDRSAGS